MEIVITMREDEARALLMAGEYLESTGAYDDGDGWLMASLNTLDATLHGRMDELRALRAEADNA